MSSRRASYDKLLESIKLLKRLADDVKRQIPSGVLREFFEFERRYSSGERVWALKKLLLLAGYIPPYLRILAGQEERRRLVYIDLFAGFGLSFVGESPDDAVLGSPLIAVLWPSVVAQHVKQFKRIPLFDFHVFVEMDSRKCAVLRQMLSYLGVSQRSVVIQGDANRVVSRVIDSAGLGSETHFLMFVDPYAGFENQLFWNNLCSLVKNYQGDVIVNLHSPMMARGVDQVDSALVRGFFGSYGYAVFCKLRRKYDSVEMATREAYKRSLSSLKRWNVREFPVRTWHGRVLYYLIFASKSKFIDRYLEWAEGRFGNISADELRSLWGIATGRQPTLTRFL